MNDTRRTLRVLAALLRYPDAELRAHAGALHDALRDERALPAARLAELGRLLERLGGDDPYRIEADYVDTFDRSRRTALHLFEHVHGDSRDRGPAMVDLAGTYERAGLRLVDGELPDHLPVVLEFASTQPPREARAFLAETAPIVRGLFGALVERGSPYAAVMGAVLELAGERAGRVDVPRPPCGADAAWAAEPSLDEAWAEPAAFGGCSTAGQSKPGQPQPVHIVRRPQELTP